MDEDDGLLPIVALDAGQRAELAAFLLSLSPADRALRFGDAAVGDARILAHCDKLDFERAIVLAVRDRDGALVGCAEMHPHGDRAELAFGVAAPQRCRGVAGRLLDAARDRARAAGLAGLEGQCLDENRPMRRVFARAGFALRREGGEWLAYARL